jgi:hypothetical protein
MATEKECAALAAVMACGRPGIHRKDAERLPLPAGWVEVPEVGFGADAGFQARAFIGLHGDTVLGFNGQDFFADALAASADADEFVTNLALDMGLASFTDALQFATQTYGLLRQRLHREGKDPSRIHLTGHGVGGGIASVLATWFDQTCTVFAQAPMRAVALMPGDFARARCTMETLTGSDDGAVKALQGFIRHPREVLAQREQLRVRHVHVRGEVHALLRSPATTVQGSEQAIDIGIQPATVKVALTLHDMKLHAALLYEPRLATLCQSSPDLLSLLIDREEEGGDLIDTLISDQHRAGLDAESALQRFVAGLAWTGEVPARGVMTDTAAG